MNGSQNDWRSQVAKHDPVAHQKMIDYLGHITGGDAIPQPYRELMLFASSTATRFRPSMETHGHRAIEQGATTDQLFQAAALASLSGGFTCLILAMEVMDQLKAVG